MRHRYDRGGDLLLEERHHDSLSQERLRNEP
jgi:hypothetical protein